LCRKQKAKPTTNAFQQNQTNIQLPHKVSELKFLLDL
jgi:hypothetical protein